MCSYADRRTPPTGKTNRRSRTGVRETLKNSVICYARKTCFQTKCLLPTYKNPDAHSRVEVKGGGPMDGVLIEGFLLKDFRNVMYAARRRGAWATDHTTAMEPRWAPA
ncbi:hypothetical protein NQZ68_027667 [Dissostichus eleginoides]|nr:hypothetical protein NQZ68_027667 [Dissostichus eleginoides]